MGSGSFAFFLLGLIQTKEFHMEPATCRNSKERYIFVIVVRKFGYVDGWLGTHARRGSSALSCQRQEVVGRLHQFLA